MLTVWEAIARRRSIRKFALNDVPDEMVERMLEAARLAPSASNRQPWRFLVVREKETKKELRRICLDQKFIEEAPVVIVCFGDLERYSKEARRKRRKESVEAGIAATLSGRFADPTYLAHLDSQSTPPREALLTPVTANTFIAIEHLVLMATALGLGTCWVGGFDDATEFNRLFGLDNNLLPVAVIPVGYPATELPPQRPRLALKEILIELEAKGNTNR